MKKLVAEVCGAVFGILSSIIVAHCSTGCAAIQSQQAVDSAYTAETVECSKNAKSKEDAQKCRAAVNRKYKVCDDPGQWPRYVPCQ